jgi:hypothetical protein
MFSLRLAVPLLAVLLLAPSGAWAQGRRKRAPKAAPARQSAADERKRAAEHLKKVREEWVKATEDYKQRLRELLPFHEADEQKRAADLEKVRRLQAEGLLSRLAVEKSEAELASAKARSQEVRTQMMAADAALAEALAEPEVEAPPPVVAGKKRTPPVVETRSGYIRYTGFADWRLSGASRVQGFFASRFGRALPVSAYGQTDLHNRMGFDHRNSLDVALHPDSPEGRALLEYLRSQGIPFLAFRGAIAGTATGPHVHIGRPSHRLR